MFRRKIIRAVNIGEIPTSVFKMFIKFLFIMLVLLIFDAGAGHDIRYVDDSISKTIPYEGRGYPDEDCFETNRCSYFPTNSEPKIPKKPKKFEPKDILNRKGLFKVLNDLPPVDDTLEMEPAMFVFNYRLRKPVQEQRLSDHE